jgi:hypothetical protein
MFDMSGTLYRSLASIFDRSQSRPRLGNGAASAVFRVPANERGIFKIPTMLFVTMVSTTVGVLPDGSGTVTQL